MPEKTASPLHLNQQLNRLAYWLPLVPFTVPTGIYRLGTPQPTDPILLLGNNRRLVVGWQYALTDLDVYLVIINTNGRPLSTAVSSQFITANSLATVVTQLKIDQDKPKQVSPSLFLPLPPVHQTLLDELESLTSVPSQIISPNPTIAAQSMRTGQSPASLPLTTDHYPFIFNLALFMSFFTLILSLTFGSTYSWLWFLLPWLACLGRVVLPLDRLRLPIPAWGVLWGILLSLPIIIWQINITNTMTALSWGGAVLLMSIWASWRMKSVRSNSF